MLNHDCALHINWCDSPRISVIQAFWFEENTIFFHEYSITNFVIWLQLGFVFMGSFATVLAMPISPNFGPSAMECTPNSMFLPTVATPEEALSALLKVEHTHHAALMRKSAMPLLVIASAMSISAVQSIQIFISCTCLSIACRLGFLKLVGFNLIPHVSHRVLKYSLNLLPLS